MAMQSPAEYRLRGECVIDSVEEAVEATGRKR